ASALAAGCPVVVKAHPSHPGVCELIGGAIVAALDRVGLPPGVFSLVYGGADEGARLVRHSAIAAVGFTGSVRAGRALAELASARPRPIPVMAEMSSVNPVLVLPGALAARPAEIAAGLAASVTLGVGQFCTNPGLVLLPPGEGAAVETFVTTLREKLVATPAAPMLSASLRKHYVQGVRTLAAEPGVETLVAPVDDAGPGGARATAGLLRVSAEAWLASDALRHEVFGPATLLVTDCDGPLMRRVLETLGGQLTVTLHGEPADLTSAADLLDTAERISGRVVWNGFPTGVEVSSAMVHGGPYPATTDGRFTSVGTRAIDRFLRPVCRQGFSVV
ncbi:MAG: aldehyde dehydrogenase family protein, partial [Cephaloticoccus sp.]